MLSLFQQKFSPRLLTESILLKEGRKGGREEGRKRRREEGRKGGRGKFCSCVTFCLIRGAELAHPVTVTIEKSMSKKESTK